MFRSRKTSRAFSRGRERRGEVGSKENGKVPSGLLATQFGSFFCLVAFFVFVSKIAWVDLVRDEGRRRERRILETFFSFLCDRTSKWYCSFKLLDRQTERSFLSCFLLEKIRETMEHSSMHWGILLTNRRSPMTSFFLCVRNIPN